MRHQIVSLVLVILSAGQVLVPAAHPVAETNCDLDKVENSLTTALKLIKFLKETGNYEEITVDESHTTHEKVPEGGETITSVSVVESNSTAGCKLRPSNCAEIQTLGNTKSGVYEVYPKWRPTAKGYKVYCDLQTEGGGWTIIQRRMQQDKQEQFNRTWTEYKSGFGNLQTEFWLGNKQLNLLTTQDQALLRIEMEDWEGMKRYAHYKGFIVYDEELAFKMSFTEYYDSTAGGDSFAPCKQAPFQTIDKDNAQKLATKFMAGFWWPNVAENTMLMNPNGVFYPKGKHLNVKDGLFWHYWKGRTYSLKRVEMKLRPLYYTPEQDLPRTVVPA